MRPVNLIPVEDRRGDGAPMRTGPLTYIFVGALLAALAGVTVLVLTNNQISDREAEVAQLQRENAAAAAEARKLEAYTEFRQVRDSRVATVTSLADSRFDWERVMRELSLVLPSNVWLVKLTGSASPNVQVEDGAEISLRDSAAGPALEMIGCASSQEAVAGFVTALRTIDGVTRVGVQSSDLPDLGSTDADSAAAPATSTAGSEDDCRTRDFIAKFEIVASFDAAPVPAAAAATSPVAPAPTSSAATPTAAPVTTPSGG